jgi:hypothetical protein
MYPVELVDLRGPDQLTQVRGTIARVRGSATQYRGRMSVSVVGELSASGAPVPGIATSVGSCGADG